MAYTVPNLPDAFHRHQAELDSGDLRVLAAGHDYTGVISGCAVTAQPTPDMTVAVATGTVVVQGLRATVTAGNITISAADPTNPRIDLVVVDSTGNKSVIAGTPAASPVYPAIPIDSKGLPTRAVLAAVYVPAGDTAINSNQITDKRVFIREPDHGNLAGVTADQHHAQLHQASHQAGGADALAGNLNANARVQVKKGGIAIGTRRALNLIEGSNVTLTVADDATNEEVDITIAAAGGGGGGELGRPIKLLSEFFEYDDFISGTATGGSIGKLGWGLSGGGTSSPLNSESGRVGLRRLSTGATANNQARLFPTNSTTGICVIPSNTFDVVIILRPNVVDSNTVIRFGLLSDVAGQPPTHGIYIEKTGTDTNWFGVCRASNTETRVDLGAITAGNWYRLRLRRKDASTISFSVNGGTELDITTNIPTNGLVWGGHVVTLAAEDKTVDLDYIDLLVTGLSR